MNTRILQTLTLIALIGSAATPIQAQPCAFEVVVTTGCNADGTGWAIVTISTKEPYLEYRWDGNEALGGPQITGLSSGTHYVMVSDGVTCETIAPFTIDCPVAPPSNCQFRTQTQGGWGSPGNGNNPGAYRNAHFAAAFPNGLEIGCANKLRLTSAAAVQAFLPSGTTARPLNTGTLVNPGQTYRNVLAGQLVALTLSVGFDAYDTGFGASTMALGSAIIQSGPFQGSTVNDLLQEANRFIGGCPSSFTAAQLNTALTAANESFVDGAGNSGFLGCTAPARRKSAGDAEARLYPVPANDRLTVEWPGGGAQRLELYDATGRIAHQQVVGGADHFITLHTGHLPEGAYILRLVGDHGDLTRRISIVR